MTICPSIPLADLTQVSWAVNEGFKYWFAQPDPDPVSMNQSHPLVILGGSREAAQPQFEVGVDDDLVVDPVVGKVLREFLPSMFSGRFEEKEPEMEWVGLSSLL
jgi:hypothetical protein